MRKHYSPTGETLSSNISTRIKVVSAGIVFSPCVCLPFAWAVVRRWHPASPLCRRDALAGSTATMTKHLRCCAFLCILFLWRVRFDLEHPAGYRDEASALLYCSLYLFLMISLMMSFFIFGHNAASFSHNGASKVFILKSLHRPLLSILVMSRNWANANILNKWHCLCQKTSGMWTTLYVFIKVRDADASLVYSISDMHNLSNVT